MSLDRPARLHLDTTDRDVFLPSINLGEVLRGIGQKLRRRWPWLAGCLVLCIALAVTYVVTATPVYTANGSILIDPRVGSSPDNRADMMPGLLMSDALTVDSELRVLVSREVTARAVRALKLGETGPVTVSRRKAFTNWIGLAPTGEENANLSAAVLDERHKEAVRRSFVRGLKVERAGDSFVLDISYTAPSVAFSALAVNTLMQEYLRLSSEQQITRAEQTRQWLSARINELGLSVEAAETAVATYRQTNQLLVPEGALLPTEIALNAAIAEQVRLRTLLVSMDVQVRQLTSQIVAGEIDTIQIAPEERTNALNDFQTRYTELRQQERELLLMWDETAPQVKDQRARMIQARDLILNEFGQIADRLGARSLHLRQQIAATDTVIAELQDQYGKETSKTVQLRSLEREANAKRVLYEQLLEQYNSTSQLLTFDATSGRVIAWAVAPDTKSAPKSTQIVILAAFAGIMLALTAIFLIETLDNSFRSQTEIAANLRVPFIGLVPMFRTDRSDPATPGLFGRSDRWRKLGRVAQRYDFAAVSPISVSAETARSIHVSLKMQKAGLAGQGQVVGMVSSLRGEGKTTTAFNFATYLAKQNERVALVDLDLISRELSRQIATVLPKANSLTDLLQAPEDTIGRLEEVPEFPGLAIIGNLDLQDPIPTATRDSARLKAALQQLRLHFDFIVVDLPPLQGAADTLLLSRMCDRLLLIIKWGHTPKQQIVSALRKSGLSDERFLGVVLTQAKLQDYRSYNPDEVTAYYS
jgi:uncharacterized protein involved in exopolysaccharide biosynthesis/Mrp family chromosome partitioning ATPase